ncbi:MAG: hypothetical protein KGL53_02695, partial [Elusimicrobia bacterium]|nr:hypothetical protein [Elusimicrobiota bacterium]
MSDTATDKDEKKGGAVPTWMTGTAKVGSGLSSGGGASAGSLLQTLGALAGPKAIVMATVFGGLALGLGVVSTIQAPKQPTMAQRFDALKEKTEAPAGALPGGAQQYQSALMMAHNANEGFYSASAAPAQAQAD